MASRYPEARLGDYVEKIGSGATPRGGESSYKTQGIALIRSQNVYNDRFSYSGLAHIDEEQAAQLQNVEVRNSDILLNITGDSVARVFQVPDDVLPARVNQHVAIVRPRGEELNARYLRFFLASPEMQAHMLSVAGAGATRNALTKGMIEGFRVPKPPLAVQQAVAHILGTLDDKIELNRQMNQTLEAIARAIFKSWFVDFDPMRARMNGEPYPLDGATMALFPDRLVESELGEIPEGWEANQIVDMGEIITGKTPPTADQEHYGGDIPFVTIPDMHGRTYVLWTSKTLSEKGSQTQKGKLLPANSICVSCIATPGLVVLTSEPSHTNQQINSIVAHKGISPYYCFFALRNLAELILSHGSGGSVYLNLSKSRFESLPILLPSAATLGVFHRAVEPIFEMILSMERQSLTLAELRDNLLPKLISGELRVPDVGGFVEEATG